jgi:hypothetical protein
VKHQTHWHIQRIIFIHNEKFVDGEPTRSRRQQSSTPSASGPVVGNVNRFRRREMLNECRAERLRSLREAWELWRGKSGS